MQESVKVHVQECIEEMKEGKIINAKAQGIGHDDDGKLLTKGTYEIITANKKYTIIQEDLPPNVQPPELTKENVITVTGYVWNPPSEKQLKEMSCSEIAATSAWRSGHVLVLKSELEALGYIKKSKE